MVFPEMGGVARGRPSYGDHLGILARENPLCVKDAGVWSSAIAFAVLILVFARSRMAHHENILCLRCPRYLVLRHLSPGEVGLAR